MYRLVALFLKLLIILSVHGQINSVYKKNNQDVLPYGNTFSFWENTTRVSNTYYVDVNHPNASDDNEGTRDAPFLTVNKAASMVKAGEKVMIMPGTYRECVVPVHGGNSPDKMIIYEAAEQGAVIIKGSYELNPKRWEKGKGWQYGRSGQEENVWQYDLEGEMFMGYNPFGMMNILHDREWLQHNENVKMWPHFKRRGMLFIEGIPALQVEKVWNMGNVGKDTICFWVEHNGMRIHVRFPENTSPADYTIEATNKEQVFAPTEYGLGYIHLKGIHFMHAGNGFPVPQRGLVSASRGHHWIIENCTIEWANSLGVDIGNEMWGTTTNNKQHGHIFRGNIVRNCGVSGLQGMYIKKALIEDNLFENIGWQDAELAFESGGIKLHKTKHTLIRRNVFRDISYASGLWLDYESSKNTRVTNNVFANIITARGAIYVEVSHEHCRIDHNVFYNLHSLYWVSGDYGAGGSAFYTDGSDSILFENNLAFNIENSGYGAYLNATRIVNKRGGITRYHQVQNNIFADCRKHHLEFANEHNFANNNVYSNPDGGYIKIGNPLPSLLLNQEAVQKMYGWEKEGIVLSGKNALQFEFDTDNLIFTITGDALSEIQKSGIGPFRNISQINQTNIDPRKLP